MSLVASRGEAKAASQWVGAWQASPTIAVTFDTNYMKLPPPVHGVVRYTMRVTAGGEALRIRLSGETREDDFSFVHASVASAEPHTPSGSTATPLTFSGAPGATVAAGAPLVSDPAPMRVKAGDDIVVELVLPRPVKLAQADRRFAVEVTDENGERIVHGARPLVSEIDVQTSLAPLVVVALGDSITDGTGGTDPMRGWPGALAERLAATGPVAVVNAGIAGNRLLTPTIGPSALARFDRDVGAVPGVTHVILLEGINDIGGGGMSYPGQPPLALVQADAIISGYRQLIARAHLRGLNIIGATLTPFAGVKFAGYYSPAKEATRQQVNAWIRRSGAFDGVVDFDAAVRDPDHPGHLRKDLDSGDHLHPSDAGYRAMAAAVDARLLSASP